MNRRVFLATLGSTLAAAACGWPSRGRAADRPRLAITIDDLDLDPAGSNRLSLEERSAAFLETLGARSLQAAVFVCGMRVDSDAGRRHLQPWSDAGHILANHSYSHWYYPGKSPEEFGADVLRAEALLRSYAGFRKRFRFPYLKEGKTAEQRDAMREFLAEHEYEMGYVTIDASDWAIDARLRKRLEREPDADLAPYRAFYLEHLGARAAYYDDLARRVLGRSVAHTILLHHNTVTALFLGDLLAQFESQGWQLVDAAAAFEDPVFSAAPMIAPAGESIVWALAKESGRFDDELRYPAEDETYETARMDELGL